MAESSLTNIVPRNTDAAICAYADLVNYRSLSPSGRFFEPHTIMEEFGGDLNDTLAVRAYLLNKVSAGERESVERRFATIEGDTSLASGFI